MDWLGCIPNEIVLHIQSYIDKKATAALVRTCLRLNNVLAFKLRTGPLAIPPPNYYERWHLVKMYKLYMAHMLYSPWGADTATLRYAT
jgi:hypothetical protein